MASEDARGQSLCPECLRLIPTRLERDGAAVYQVKDCPEHGRFRTLVWRGPPEFDAWRRPKTPAALSYYATDSERGCPFDCGLCPQHRQRTCTALVEVARGCDLGCPVCYADSPGRGGPEPGLAEIEAWFRAVLRAAPGSNVQLSGGEPAIRDDLPEIVALGRALGLGFIQLNSNGLRLGREPGFARALAQAGLDSVFLQFDGVDDRVYRRLRGRDLLAAKLAAIEACAAAGLGVVLVPTLAAGVNDDQAGAIIGLAMDHLPTVRAVHFQPLSRFGRFPADLPDEDRLTLPDLMRAIEAQTDGRFPASAFRPPGCENALCSFQGNFLVQEDGTVRALSREHDPCCSSPPEPAEPGALRAIARVARNWAAPPVQLEARLPASSGASAAAGPDGPVSLDAFLDLARRRTLSVSAMAFQDACNLDLERVRDCCIHVVAPDGRLVPFCLYNLTSRSGERLYRP